MRCIASVIIPVFNAEKTLRRCVESLVLGEERNIEVILCEDCSIDNSWQLCQELSGEFANVKCIRNEENSGVSFTRNQGIDAAQGTYLFFVDSDDWVSHGYIKQLLQLAQKDADILPVSGLHFIDKVNNLKRDYLYNTGREKEAVVLSNSFFELLDQFLLQQLWNKVFQRDIIEAHHIRFDETQTMGEDFQFVLDYLEAAQIKKCVVLNEPLYYYIRWNDTSLMSKFGFVDSKIELERMDQLARIVGSGAEKRKAVMIAQSRRNAVYHIVRNRNHTRQEKLEAIERIMDDGKATAYYWEQKCQHFKEQLAEMLGNAKKFIPRIRSRLQRMQLEKKIAQAVGGVDAQGVTFISQNCIGGVLYHDLGLQFLSPTVNLFIPEPGFVKLVLNLRHYMAQELVVRWDETYPIGMLEDVEIHFMHYETCKEAEEAWNRRKERINWDKILVIGTDRNGFDELVFDEWKRIQYPKILFTTRKKFDMDPDSVCFSEYEGRDFVPDLIPGREFYRNHVLIDKINSIGGIDFELPHR